MVKKHFLTIIVCLYSTLFLPQESDARLNSLTAGITTGYDITDTTYDNGDISEGTIPPQNKRISKLSIGPIIIIKSSSSMDELSIDYRPSYAYDTENSTSDMDHNFSLSGYRNLSKELRLDVNEKFIYSDDPNLIVDNSSSDYNKERKRYWTNTVTIKPTYTYDTKSFFGGSYTYRLLRNDDTGIGGYEDYDKHTADLFLTHRFDSSWNIEGDVAYTRGLFNPPEQAVVDQVVSGITAGTTSTVDADNFSNDLSEYHANAIVNWVVSPSQTLQTRYKFSASNYEAILRNDSILHNVSFGVEYQYSKQLSVSLGGGPSYEKTDSYNANWNYNAYFDFNYSLSQRTAFSVSAEKGYEYDNFSSNNNQLGRDQGLTEFLDWQLNFSHKLLKNLDLSLFASYRDEQQESIVQGITTVIGNEINLQGSTSEERRQLTVFDRDIYRGGVTIKYVFMEYWTTALNYTYRKQDSEQINDSYDENRAYLTLAVQNELFRW